TLLSLNRSAALRDLHSFPTRRSSDLLGAEGAAYTVVEGALPDSLKGGAPEAVAVTRNRGTEGYEEFVFSFDQRVVRSYLRSGERSEEHTSELQSRENLVCRLLLEKKK